MESNHETVIRTLARVEEKIDGINRRLDIVNGRLNKHDDRLLSIDVSDGKQNTKLGLIASVAGIVGGAIVTMFFK